MGINTGRRHCRCRGVNAVDVEKQFIPDVRKHFKRGCYGAASVSSQSLLPLLANMPPRTLIERGADGSPMAGLRGVLERRLAGWSFLSSSAVRANEAREMVPALCEGVLYSVLKLAPLTDHAEECATRVCVDDVVGVWMREFLVARRARSTSCATPSTSWRRNRTRKPP